MIGDQQVLLKYNLKIACAEYIYFTEYIHFTFNFRDFIDKNHKCVHVHFKCT